MADNLIHGRGFHVLNSNTEGGSPIDWPTYACNLVYDWRKNGLAKDPIEESSFSVYVVWFCFILGGWKALVSTTLPDGRYYEVTYNKAKGEIYLDTYKKTHNNVITIEV